MSDEPMQEETRAQFASRLEAAVQEALGTDALPNPEGWQLGGVRMVAMRGGDARRDENLDPALEFTLPDRTLTVAVLFTDPKREAFRRTPRYDILYLTGKEDAEATIYKASSDMLERLAAWVDAWDRGVPVTPPALESSLVGPGTPEAPAKEAGGTEPASDDRAQFASRLEASVREALGTSALPNPDGWRLGSVRVAAMRGETTLLEASAATALVFELPDRALTVAVLPTDPSKTAFLRTPRYDILYLAANKDGDDDTAYEASSDMLERFAAWVDAWDRGVPVAERSVEPSQDAAGQAGSADAPAGTEPSPGEDKARFAARLEAAVREALGTDALPNPDGWRLGGVRMVATRGNDALPDATDDPALVFELSDRVLSVAVLSTDPHRTAFRRTPRYDILYLAGEGGSDDPAVYEENSDLLERLAAWVDAWDRGLPVSFPLASPPLPTVPMPVAVEGADGSPALDEGKARFAARLEAAVREALGTDALPNPDGWRLGGVRMVATRGSDALPDTTDDPALVFELPDRKVTVAVLLSDPHRTAFRRTPRYDILYVAEAGANDADVYEANTDLLERFAAWVDAWDRSESAEPPPAGA